MKYVLVFFLSTLHFSCSSNEQTLNHKSSKDFDTGYEVTTKLGKTKVLKVGIVYDDNDTERSMKCDWNISNDSIILATPLVLKKQVINGHSQAILFVEFRNKRATLMEGYPHPSPVLQHKIFVLDMDNKFCVELHDSI